MRRGSQAAHEWRAIPARPETAGGAFVLETPGDAESHATQLALLRSLAPA